MRLLLLLLLTVPSLLSAQGDSAAPEAAFRKLLQEKCYDCHHPDTSDEPPYLHEKINLTEIIDGDLVVKGDAAASALFHRVTLAPDDRKRMPRSRGAAGGPPALIENLFWEGVSLPPLCPRQQFFLHNIVPHYY